MEYEVKLAPSDKIITTPEGIFEPLCNSCSSPDCTNPIHEKTLSIIGQLKKNRLYIVNESVVRQVVACKGYVGDASLPPSPMGGKSTDF